MVTIEQVKAMRLRVVLHIHGERTITKLHESVEQPRLGNMEIYNRRSRVTERCWTVDNRVYDSLEAAVEALNATEAGDA